MKLRTIFSSKKVLEFSRNVMCISHYYDCLHPENQSQISIQSRIIEDQRILEFDWLRAWGGERVKTLHCHVG